MVFHARSPEHAAAFADAVVNSDWFINADPQSAPYQAAWAAIQELCWLVHERHIGFLGDRDTFGPFDIIAGNRAFRHALCNLDDLAKLIAPAHQAMPAESSKTETPPGVKTPATSVDPPRGGHKSRRAKQAIDAIWRDGPPDQTVLPNDLLCKQVNEWIATDCKARSVAYSPISPDTILTAAGRKKPRTRR
jgi:hypothetical protein